jgi:hypothetical protein
VDGRSVFNVCTLFQLHGAPISVSKQKGKVVVAALAGALESVLRSQVANPSSVAELSAAHPDVTPPPPKPAISGTSS